MKNNQALPEALQQQFASFGLFFSVLYVRALPKFIRNRYKAGFDVSFDLET